MGINLLYLIFLAPRLQNTSSGGNTRDQTQRMGERIFIIHCYEEEKLSLRTEKVKSRP